MHTTLLLPGLACDAELFADISPELEQLGAVRVADSHSRCTTLAEMAAANWAEHHRAEHSGPLALVGVSMGGMVALEMQRQAPQRVTHLALLGTTARPDTPELIALRIQACALFAQGRMDEVLRANLAFAFHPTHAADKALTARYLAMIRRAGAQQLIAQNHAVMARVDSRPALRAIRCPTLVLCGEADLLTPPEHAREMAQLIPGARLELLPAAGHMLTLEQGPRVATLLKAWMSALMT
jgi:pimeloyl-ACP methyl ester carboxylesterase